MSDDPNSQPWIVQQLNPGVHVVPGSDHIAHDLDEECDCGPTSIPETRADGSVGWIIVHHSLGRTGGRRMICQNCGGTDKVADLSFDLDLPTIRLCGICSVLIVTDRETFDDLGRRRTRRRKP